MQAGGGTYSILGNTSPERNNVVSDFFRWGVLAIGVVVLAPILLEERHIKQRYIHTQFSSANQAVLASHLLGSIFCRVLNDWMCWSCLNRSFVMQPKRKQRRTRTNVGSSAVSSKLLAKSRADESETTACSHLSLRDQTGKRQTYVHDAAKILPRHVVLCRNAPERVHLGPPQPLLCVFRLLLLLWGMQGVVLLRRWPAVSRAHRSSRDLARKLNFGHTFPPQH